MQTKESIQINNSISRNADSGPERVIRGLAVRHNDVQSVSRAALEDDNQALGSCARVRGRENSPL